jgi:hypothetical protein
MAAILGLFSCLPVLLANRTAYVAPLAIIQDITATHQALKGESLPTTEIGPLVKQVLAQEDRPAYLKAVWPWLATNWPGLAWIPMQNKKLTFSQ